MKFGTDIHHARAWVLPKKFSGSQVKGQGHVDFARRWITSSLRPSVRYASGGGIDGVASRR